MERKMFGHRMKKSNNSERVPGKPFTSDDYNDDEEDSYKYAKSKDAFGAHKGAASGRAKGGPEGYEGKEHVKYKDPGHTRGDIRYPDDEPHQKSNVSKEEMHEMEDNYHMAIPDQTKYTLEEKIKRAKMKMDDPDYLKPKPLRGTLVETSGKKGVFDGDGKEEMGPNYMQQDMSKERRKKMVVGIAKSKMKKSSK